MRMSARATGMTECVQELAGGELPTMRSPINPHHGAVLHLVRQPLALPMGCFKDRTSYLQDADPDLLSAQGRPAPALLRPEAIRPRKRHYAC